MFSQTKCSLIYDTEVINIFVNVFLSLLNVSTIRQKSFVLLECQGKLLVPMARSMLSGCRVAGEDTGGSLLTHKAAQQEESMCLSVYLPLN